MILIKSLRSAGMLNPGMKLGKLKLEHSYLSGLETASAPA